MIILSGYRDVAASCRTLTSRLFSKQVMQLRAIGSPMSKRQPEKTSIARRELLARGVMLAGSAASAAFPTASAGAADENLPPHVPSWMKEQGAPFLSPPYGQPSPFEKNVTGGLDGWRRRRVVLCMQLERQRRIPVR
jgi:hypothetical protein